MSRRLVGLGMMALFLFVTGAVKARAADVDISFFYNELAPYGEWVSVAPYGWVWTPYNTPPGWRPYTDGSWAYTDFGWTFVSPVDWGWAAYHYGRWTFNPEYGWIWVPDTVWGPSWVAWRFGGDFMGWAPLPPEIGWSAGFGLELGGFDLDYGIPGHFWCFVEASRFGDRDMDRYIINSARNEMLIRNTKNVTNYRIVNNRIVNNNIETTQLEKLTGKKITRYQIVEEPQAAGKTHTAQIKGAEIQMFRPAISSRKATVEPKNVLPPREMVPTEKMLQRQKEEKNQLNSHYEGKLNQLDKSYQADSKTLPKGTSKEELDKRHQEEVKALEEQRKREAQVLENRHRREQERSQAQPRTPERPPKKK